MQQDVLNEFKKVKLRNNTYKYLTTYRREDRQTGFFFVFTFK